MVQLGLEGYLLTGRHGLFSSYETFIHIVDLMFNPHAKWLKHPGAEQQLVVAGVRFAQLRSEVGSGLAWIGGSVDESRDRAASNPVSDGASRCQVLVLAAQEHEQIVRHTWALLVPGHSRQSPAARVSHG